ncbi:hypothetical protein, partial [Phaeodactylibacter luteus]|uniref:hypothetical protein n=1 Tax=Phaeodactylibacter luteus TaxID=1564516 RepID=UPI001B8869E7
MLEVSLHDLVGIAQMQVLDKSLLRRVLTSYLASCILVLSSRSTACKIARSPRHLVFFSVSERDGIIRREGTVYQ